MMAVCLSGLFGGLLSPVSQSVRESRRKIQISRSGSRSEYGLRRAVRPPLRILAASSNWKVMRHSFGQIRSV